MQGSKPSTAHLEIAALRNGTSAGACAKPLAPLPVEIQPETVADGFVAVTWRAERVQLTKNPAFAGFCVCLRDVVEHLRTIALVPGEDSNKSHNPLI